MRDKKPIHILKMRFSNLSEEKKLWKKGYKRVVGLDESGRGTLAGPVIASAVVINKFSIFNFQFSKLQDSKHLSPKARQRIYKSLITTPGIWWGIGKVSEKIIDKINILRATKLAMERAIKDLEKKLQKQKNEDNKDSLSIDFLIIDGNFKLNLPLPQKAIVKGDEKVLSCTLASILAKVYRDKIMEGYHKKYPKYGFSKHKGYPTKYHLKMLKKYGPSKIHRKSFEPVKTLSK